MSDQGLAGAVIGGILLFVFAAVAIVCGIVGAVTNEPLWFLGFLPVIGIYIWAWAHDAVSSMKKN